ncbi:hypothetical protein FKM82_025658 [Ascaphus truei]
MWRVVTLGRGGVPQHSEINPACSIHMKPFSNVTLRENCEYCLATYVFQRSETILLRTEILNASPQASPTSQVFRISLLQH